MDSLCKFNLFENIILLNKYVKVTMKTISSLILSVQQDNLKKYFSEFEQL